MQPKLQKVASFDIPEDKVKEPNPTSPPPTDSKLKFVVSNFTHDNQFVYKPPSSANYINPRKRLLNLSQPLDQDSDESEPMPDRPILEYYQAEKSPKNAQTFNEKRESREPSYPILETKENGVTKLRETPAMTPANLSIVTTRTTRPVKMRDLVRRKSCHCSECGGLSRLEKKTLDLKPQSKYKKKLDITQDLIPIVQTPVSNPRSVSKSKKGGDMRQRGTSVAAIMQIKRKDSMVQSLDVETRPRTKTTGRKQDELEPIKAENFEKLLDKGIEPSTGKTIREVQETDRIESLLDKLSDLGDNVPKVMNGKPSKFKTANFQTKKIHLKNMVPHKVNKVPKSARIDYKANISNIASMKGNDLLTERIEKKGEDETRAKVNALKTLLAKKRSEAKIEAKAVEIPSLESLPGAGCLDLYLKKVNRKGSASSIPDTVKRSASVSRLSDGSIIVQKGVVSATKCYKGTRGRIEEINSITGTGSWIERVRMENMSGRMSERESLRDRRGYFNAVRGDMTCEKILRSVRDSLERERDVEMNENQGKENEKKEDRIEQLKGFIPMFLMNNRVRLPKT